MKSCVRQTCICLLRYMGIAKLFEFIHRKHITILTVHGVMDEQGNPSWRPLRPQLSRAKLEEYLCVLSRRYHFVTLMEAVEMLQGKKPMEPYSIALTFDDGYRNNITHALPILRRYNVPATFFIPTGFVDKPRPFWFDRLDYALQQVSVHGREMRVGSVAMRFDGSSREALQESYKRFRRAAKEQDMPDGEFLGDMERLAEQLEAESGKALADIQKHDDWSAIMTWEQIEATNGGDVTFGGHTVDHVRLKHVDTEVTVAQIKRSKRDIEEHTHTPCLSLCFPNGSCTDETVALARECGYLCSFTPAEGTNRVGDDVMRLKRSDLPIDMDGRELFARLALHAL